MPNISIPGADLNLTSAYLRLDGKVALAGGELWDAPAFAGWSPTSAFTYIRNGPLKALTSSNLTFFLQEADYAVRTGLLYGDSGVGAAYGTVTCLGVQAGDTVTLGGILFTAVAGAPAAHQFQVNADNGITATNLAAAITAASDSATLVQAFQNGASPFNVCEIESLVRTSAGNAITLASSNNTRLAVSGATLTGGSNLLSESAPFWSFAYRPSGISLAAGKSVTLSFDVNSADVAALSAPTARCFINFGDGAGAHYTSFSLVAGRVTSTAVAPVALATNVSVGVDIIGYKGKWVLGNFSLLQDQPATFATAGQIEVDVDLSAAAPAPSGDATVGISGGIKRLGFFYGASYNTRNFGTLSQMQSGDKILLNAPDVNSQLLDATSQRLLSDAKLRGIKGYGYLALGRNTDAVLSERLSEATLSATIATMAGLGYDGVFWDICGQSPSPPNGYGNSRFRQNVVAALVHGHGMKNFWNGGSGLFDNNLDPRIADLDDSAAATAGTGTVSSAGAAVTGVGTNFLTAFPIGSYIKVGASQVIVSAIADDLHLTTGAALSPAASTSAYSILKSVVNDGTALAFTTGDACLLESFGLFGSTQYEDWYGMFSEGITMAQILAARNVEVWPLGYAIVGSNFLQQKQQEEYMYYLAALLGFTGYAITGTGLNLFGNRPAVPLGSSYVDPTPILSPSGSKATRATDVGVIQILRDLTKLDTDATARTGSAYQRFSQVTVSNVTSGGETLNGGGIAWSHFPSSDGKSFGSEATLTDTAGMITGFPAVSPGFDRLKVLFTTPDNTKTPLLTPPLVLSVTYGSAGYCLVTGTILPTAADETISSIQLQIQRTGATPFLIGTQEFGPSNESKTLAVNRQGIWQVYLAAAAGAGTQYNLTLISGNDRLVKTLTLVASGTVQF